MTQQRTVLIVDDSLEDRETYRRYLLQNPDCHYTILEAGSGEEGLELCQRLKPDGILLDYLLPDLDGLEFLSELRLHNAIAPPAIMLTGQGNEIVAVQAMKAGAQDYLIKGRMTPESLRLAVDGAIDKAQLRAQLQQSEERLKLALEATHIGIWEWNILTDQVMWSQSLEILFGIEPETFAGTYAAMLEPVHPDDLDSVTQTIARSLAQRSSYQIEYRIQHPDASIRWVACQGQVFDDETGKPVRMIGATRDISDRKQTESVLRKAKDELERKVAERTAELVNVNRQLQLELEERQRTEQKLLRIQRLESLGILASGIAHDLNNILTPILMSVQLIEMQRHLDFERCRQPLKIIEDSARRGAAVVKQVLLFARGVEGERTLLQLRQIIGEIQQVVQATFPKSITVQTQIASTLWTVYGDTTQLHQVLMNLCVNARDAMPNGGTLSICAENLFIDEHYARMNLEAQVGPYAVMTIADTGVGIPPEVMERIFEPFFTTKSVGSGTGLGLSTVIGIVKSHGGFVNVCSEVEQGTEFKVYLPAVSGTETVADPDTELPIGHGELVLVVDDELAIREIARTALETYSYKVLTAGDGIEAIALYAQHKYEISVVLMDMMMPAMDGATAIAVLQKMNPQISIIALSGLASNQKVAEAAGPGIKAFLSKPYTAKELLYTINGVLNA